MSCAWGRASDRGTRRSEASGPERLTAWVVDQNGNSSQTVTGTGAVQLFGWNWVLNQFRRNPALVAARPPTLRLGAYHWLRSGGNGNPPLPMASVMCRP